MPRPHGPRDELRPARRALRRGAGRRSLPAAGRARERGLTWVGALLAVLLVAAGYLAWVWVPVYQLHYEVKQSVRDFGNQAVKETRDGELVQGLSGRLKSLAREPVVGEDGKVTMEPVVRVEPQDIVWERLAEDRLHVGFTYERTVELPWLKRWVTRPFDVDLTLDVSRADWGKR